MKVVIFDSGVLITLSMNSLLDMLVDLRKVFKGKFVITREIEEEIVKKPLTIKKYKLGAIRLRKLINDKILEFPESLGIDSSEVRKVSYDILKQTNSIYFSKNHPVHIIDTGEASALALSKILRQKKIENIIAVDERTTRILCEKPENLREILENKLHTKIEEKGQIDKDLQSIFFIRSTELVYIAFKKGLIEDQSKDMLDALLYGTKFKGASVSGSEIKEMERLSL
ncbi:hypothetical protein COU56_02060 [Candidatus Pacearchaeota archaeon CG10_big_fil_rev_8_21_14_0_10_31_9]|nr:MAG: hypothetical protein AUJ63_00885 [Candidatus Pacearchaeota archaeon CG1_02_35_32]PIN95287.1 MAG: hypothetical protein COU56_02060 [Candidatus Pacearchaeota archaeon CG10_big_fil_rev_8_21_14_0_10_31_9]PIZ82562.1 MAG: hypothetical protein COX97_04155 [Candidatus Pacearchaeota archaeon CG_4_10_14_0_2_um_filter_05_32_18]